MKDARMIPGWPEDEGPLADLLARDGFAPAWLATRHLSTLRYHDGRVTYRIRIEGAVYGDDLADLAWLEGEGYCVRMTARTLPIKLNRAPYMAVRIEKAGTDSTTTTTNDEEEQR